MSVTEFAVYDVLAERRRQVEAEGWTPEHDDTHDRCELATAAACYALAPSPVGIEREWVYPDPPKNWPWHRSWWKPSFYRRNLVKAGALILAEIERWDRLKDTIDKTPIVSARATDNQDAERFRALMRCGRIKMQGSAGVDPRPRRVDYGGPDMIENHVFAAIEQAQQALALYKSRTEGIPKEGHRALSVVATKLDEARLWFDEAHGHVEAAVAKGEPSR